MNRTIIILCFITLCVLYTSAQQWNKNNGGNRCENNRQCNGDNVCLRGYCRRDVCPRGWDLVNRDQRCRSERDCQQDRCRQECRRGYNTQDCRRCNEKYRCTEGYCCKRDYRNW